MNQKPNHKSKKSSLKDIQFALTFGLSVSLVSLSTACKSRFFSFGEDPMEQSNNQAPTDTPQARQIAIGEQNAANPSAQTKSNQLENRPTAAPYSAFSGTELKLKLGSSQKTEINGQQVEVTFESIIEDSRCPSDVMCIWEGQAKLQFSIQVPALNLSKKVTPTLRLGHPELGQVIVGAVALQLTGLSPDSRANDQKASSSEATIVLGKAP